MSRSFTKFLRENYWKPASQQALPVLPALPEHPHPSDRELYAEYVGTYYQAIKMTSSEITFWDKVEEFFKPQLRRERLAAREFYKKRVEQQLARYHEVCDRLDKERTK